MSLCEPLYNAAPTRERVQLDMSMERLRGRHFIDGGGPRRDCRVCSKRGVPGAAPPDNHILYYVQRPPSSLSGRVLQNVPHNRTSAIVKNILYTTPLLLYTSILSPHFYTTYLYLYSPYDSQCFNLSLLYFMYKLQSRSKLLGNGPANFNKLTPALNCMLHEINMLSLFTNTLVRY